MPYNLPFRMFGDRFEGVYCTIDNNGSKKYNLPVDIYDTSCSPYFKKKFAVYTDKFSLPKRAVKLNYPAGTYEEKWDAILFQWCYNTTSPINEGFYCFVFLDETIGTGARTDIITSMCFQLKYAALEENNELFKDQCEAIHNSLVTEERAEMTCCWLKTLIHSLQNNKRGFKQDQIDRWVWVIDFLRQKLHELDNSGFTLNMRMERALNVRRVSKKWEFTSKYLRTKLNSDLITKI